MELFYCPELSEASDIVLLSPEESRHALRVLRKRPGDALELTNGKGLLAAAVIEPGKSSQIRCKIKNIRQVPPPPDRNIHIALAAIRPNRMDWAVEKLTELGVGGIRPLITEFTSVKTFKKDHLQKIAVSAIKQSGQAYLPELSTPLPFADYVQQLSSTEYSLRLIAHHGGESKNISHFRIQKEDTILILVGPEGGFSGAEIDLAFRHGFSPLNLAGQILRAETAAVTAAAQVKVYFL